MKKLRIVLADDHMLLRKGLKSLIDGRPDMEVVGEAQDGNEAILLAERLAPDVMIMDITMPGLNGIEATQRIHARQPEIGIIALSAYSDRLLVQKMMGAGASGYMLKDCAQERVVEAITQVSGHEFFLCPQVAQIMMKDYSRLSKREGEAESQLTSREREIVQLIVEGNSTKEIAAAIHVSVKTVETHRLNAMMKIGVGSVAELTKYAIREGLTSLE